MPTEKQILAAAKAMFLRHNSPCMVKVLWSDLSQQAQLGYIEDASAALEAAENLEWQTAETIPTDGTPIIGYWEVGCEISAGSTDGKQWFPDCPHDEKYTLPDYWRLFRRPVVK